MADSLDSRAYSGTSFPGSASSLSDDNSFQHQERVEGFDYEFVPPPDSKYECVICLLVLREPQQTKCGHRFCKACITKWLRESNKTCPVDNEKIVESDLFADNFVKREIQNFNVCCPNKSRGCSNVEMLSVIQKHVDECPYGLIPCPNSCSDILLRRDLFHHLSSVCCYRQVLCEDCRQQTTFNGLSKHATKCPESKVTCDHCGLEFSRKMLQHHENTDCQKVVISCMFQPLGCKEKIERGQTDNHMNCDISDHMKMLCSEVVQISRCLGLPTGRNYSPVESETISSMHATQMSEDLLSRIVPSLNRLSLGSDNRHSDQSEVLKLSADDTLPVSTTSTEEFHDSYSSKPCNKESLEGFSNIKSSIVSENDFKYLRHQNSIQNESLAHHAHELTEIHQKYKELEQINRDLKQKVRVLENRMDEKDGRACNGIYYWKIKDYQKLKHEAQNGNTPAIHSPPFFSSYYGYKLCIRVNLNGVDNAKGIYLSVFIHFLQGDYDNVLEWPFSGRIVISVIDQNAVCEYRNHIVETLIAKPNLAAFQKPTSQRNHKGFGYMEYVPLTVLDNGQFVKNDTLIIKAHVIPSG